MSVTIRLAKIGKRHAPSYKVVVANTRHKRNGRFLEVLGYYNPTKSPEEFKINSAQYEEWKGKGALVSPAVEQLVAGEYTYVKYEPNKKKEEETKVTSEVREDAVEETEKAEETNELEETKAE